MLAFSGMISRLSCATVLGATLFSAACAAQTAVDDPALRLNTVRAGAPGTPRGVPDGYVVTPAGYFHPSCVRHVRADEVVDMRSGAIVDARGTVKRAAAACRYPRFTAAGERIDTALSAKLHSVDGAGSPGGDAKPDDNGVPVPDDTIFVGGFDKYSGWIESVWAHVTPTQAISYLKVDFKVPNPPPNPSTPTNYFFPGAQSLDQHPAHGTIIQPVLGWYGPGNSHSWDISGWNCCVDGNVNQGPGVNVQVGDTIRGELVGTSCTASTGVCANWAIKATDLASGQSVTLNSSAYGQAFNWIFAGVLEVYNVGTCSDLSSSGHLDFTDIVVRDLAGQNVALDYYTDTPSSSVWCGFGTYTLTEHTAYRLTF